MALIDSILFFTTTCTAGKEECDLEVVSNVFSSNDPMMAWTLMVSCDCVYVWCVLPMVPKSRQAYS